MQTQNTPRSTQSCSIVNADGSASAPLAHQAGDAESSANADAEPPEPSSTPTFDSSNSSDLTVEIIIGVDELPSHLVTDELVGFLRDAITAVALHMGIQSGSVTANLIDDEEMIELHDHFCGLTSTTDVLTFDLSESEDDWNSDVFAAATATQEELTQAVNLHQRTHIEVDLALCIDEAARQAETRHHPLKEELLLYAIHGLLHCLGHDDHDPENFQAMHRLEDQLLQKIGIAPVFGNGSRDDE